MLIFYKVGLKNNQQLEMKFLHITRIIQLLKLKKKIEICFYMKKEISIQVMMEKNIQKSFGTI